MGDVIKDGVSDQAAIGVDLLHGKRETPRSQGIMPQAHGIGRITTVVTDTGR